jgi:hypothetical protein
MVRMMALLGLLGIPMVAADFSLKGIWKVTYKEAASMCGNPAAMIENLNFEISDAPYFNRAASSFKLSDANVEGTISVQVHLEHQRYPETIVSGLLVGELVKNASGKVTLQGYIISKDQYGRWLANKKQGMEPAGAGEVELEVSGNSIHGYTLTGLIRSGETCASFNNIDAAARDLAGLFGRDVPSKGSARVTLTQQ